MLLGKLRNIAFTIISFFLATEKNSGCIFFKEEVIKGVWTASNMVWRHRYWAKTRIFTNFIAIYLQNVHGLEECASSACFWNWVGAAVSTIRLHVKNDGPIVLALLFYIILVEGGRLADWKLRCLGFHEEMLIINDLWS